MCHPGGMTCSKLLIDPETLGQHMTVTPPPQHIPVLYQEVIEGLNIQPSGCYLDGTFGRGGHARAILERLGPSGRLIAIDRDPEAVQSISSEFRSDPRFHFHHGCFADLYSIVQHNKLVGKVNGILLDIGVSSPQIQTPKRGFSFYQDGPLDMRMDPTQGISAALWLEQAEESDILWVLRTFGEEPFAKRIANAIVVARMQAPIATTLQLANIISAVVPKARPGKKHPATQSFQAIRIYINQELEQLKKALEEAMKVLAPGGRLCVISFHSLEDRIVKRFFQAGAAGDVPKGVPLQEKDIVRNLKVLKKVRASDQELKQNPRARSATLRIAEKVG